VEKRESTEGTPEKGTRVEVFFGKGAGGMTPKVVRIDRRGRQKKKKKPCVFVRVSNFGNRVHVICIRRTGEKTGARFASAKPLREEEAENGIGRSRCRKQIARGR